jgi:hypothetical protein
MRRIPLVVLWFLAVGLVPAVSAIAATAQTNTFPPPLVGTWTRTVSQADVTREQGFSGLAGSRCTLIVHASGSAHIGCPQVVNFTGKLVPEGTNRVQIAFADVNPNTYTWRVSGPHLTLTKIKDPTPDRAATMSGTWTRK